MSKDRPYLVVIDPGHGGKDLGAVNAGKNLRESDINLLFARALELEVAGGDYLFRVRSTRDADMFVSLPDRCAFSNRFVTDAFVSLHCNAADNKAAKGFEVWTTRGKTASDRLSDEIFWSLSGAFPDGVPGRPDFSDNDFDKESGFYVLKNTIAPAVLVELDFITNDQRADWLSKPTSHARIAAALADALEYWLEGGK